MTKNITPSQPLAPESGHEATPSPELDEEARRRIEAIIERINDTYARFTPEEMEMVKWLGWG